jgi:hypothetical protein
MEITVFVQYYHYLSIISIIFERKEIILKLPTLLNTEFPLFLPSGLLEDLVKNVKKKYICWNTFT